MWLISLHLSLIVQSCTGHRRVYNDRKVEQASERPPQFTLITPLRILTTIPRMTSITNSIGTNPDPTIDQSGEPHVYMQPTSQNLKILYNIGKPCDT